MINISELSTVKLLEALGGECAGTVSFYSSENKNIKHLKNGWKQNDKNYRKITNQEIFEMIQNINERPLLYGDKELRLSLAGAQEKISLAFFNNKWHLPINGAPSTHILKPTIPGTLSTIAANEYICMQLAKNMKMQVPETQLIYIEDIPVFVCERYDRKLNIDENRIERIHQENFCQALCVMSDNKYQADGGPSYSDCLKLIQNTSSNPLQDTSKFLKSILFNYLIGNCDAHAKNYSLITAEEKIYLSPLYDLVSTAIYKSLTQKMSMKIGTEYDIKKITRSDFTKQADFVE